MLKICWLSSCTFSDVAERATGTWLKPLADGLIRSGEVRLYNITRNFTGQSEVHNIACGVEQWILPRYRFGEGLLPNEPRHICQRVKEILDEIQPDVVHIWGTEFKWASIFAQGYIHYRCFVDMQGILYPYSRIYYADLNKDERQAAAFCPTDILHPRSSLWWRQHDLAARGQKELAQLPQFSHVSVQSKFVEEYIHQIAPKVKQLHTGIILRNEFYAAEDLHFGQQQPPRIFTIASTYDIPYKGLHTLLRALTILKRQYPDIELWLGGRPLRQGKQASGYERWLHDYIRANDLGDNIRQLGSLDAKQMLEAMQQCTIGVVPSFIETYCLGLAEMMMAGMACVVSKAGAMPELAVDGKEALFFTAGDAEQLAKQATMLIEDPTLRASIGVAARQRRLHDNNPATIVLQQIQNYKTIINDIKTND